MSLWSIGWLGKVAEAGMPDRNRRGGDRHGSPKNCDEPQWIFLTDNPGELHDPLHYASANTAASAGGLTPIQSPAKLAAGRFGVLL